MNDLANRDTTLDCPLRRDWVSFRLVNEHGEGKPYAGLAYLLHDSQGQKYEGLLDGDGYAKVEGFHCGPPVLSLAASYGGGSKWYEHFADRKAFKLPLTALQVAAEQSPTGPRCVNGRTYLAEERATREKARFLRVEVSDFAKVTSHLPRNDSAWHPRPSATLKQSAGLAKEQLGTALAPNQHHVLEVKALRAYRPLLSLSKEFNALDAYQFALMATQSYAPFNLPFDKDPKGEEKPPYSVPGTLGHVLDTTLAHCAEPDTFGGATPYHLLTEEVPYSKRLEIVPHDKSYADAGLSEERSTPQAVHFLHQPANILRGTLGETQAFITHDDRMVLIVARGTQEIADWLRDVNAAQVPNEAGSGQAHHGFHEAFKTVRDFVVPYLDAFSKSNQKIVVCGHSLGGAIALLLAEWLRNNWSEDVLLYTYGSPRAGDEAFVKGASALTHHRIVNHNDLIPTVPAPWMDTENALLLPGAAALISGATGAGAVLFLAGVVNLSGDDYQHHGQQWHFMPLPQADGPPTSVLWKPGCAGIEEATCARYNYLALKGDMPERSSLSVMDHTMLGGYIPACHATLLRWQESLKRDGSTLTNLEQKWLSDEIETYGKKLRRWKNVTWSQYKNDPRHRSIPTWDLRRNYQEAKAAIEEDVTVEIDKLDMTLQRLALLAQQPITPEAVYGQAYLHPEFEKLVSRWQAHSENRKAPQLARIPGPSSREYA